MKKKLIIWPALLLAVLVVSVAFFSDERSLRAQVGGVDYCNALMSEATSLLKQAKEAQLATVGCPGGSLPAPGMSVIPLSSDQCPSLLQKSRELFQTSQAATKEAFSVCRPKSNCENTAPHYQSGGSHVYSGNGMTCFQESFVMTQGRACFIQSECMELSGGEVLFGDMKQLDSGVKQSLQIIAPTDNAVVSGSVKFDGWVVGLTRQNGEIVHYDEFDREKSRTVQNYYTVKVDDGPEQKILGYLSDYVWDSTSVPNGSHKIKITGVDGETLKSFTRTLSLKVNNNNQMFAVNVAAPADGAEVSGATAVRASLANPTKATGASHTFIVPFYRRVGGQLVREDRQETRPVKNRFYVAVDDRSLVVVYGDTLNYSLDTKQFPDGDHVLKITGVDEVAGKTVFKTTKIKIKNGLADTIAPVVAIKSPGLGVLPKAGYLLTITADATDAGGVAKMIIMVNGNLLETCAARTHCTRTIKVDEILPIGSTIIVSAIDQAGNIGSDGLTTTKGGLAKGNARTKPIWPESELPSSGPVIVNDVTTGCENGKPIATASWSGARDTSGNYWYAIIPGTSYTGGSNYYSGLGPNASMRSTWLRHASTGAALELTPGQSYLFRVFNGEYSLNRSFVAPTCGPNTRPTPTAPLTPTLTATTGASDAVALNWTGSGTGVTYDVYRSASPQATNPTLLRPGQSALGYQDSTATPGTTYYYWVCAVPTANPVLYRCSGIVSGKRAGGVTTPTPDPTPTPTPTPEADPVIRFRSPAAGATVSGPVSVNGTVQNANYPYTARLLVDGNTVATISSSSAFPTFSWNSSGATAGNHSLVIALTDAKGRTGQSTPLTVTIANSSTTPPPSDPPTPPTPPTPVPPSNAGSIDAFYINNAGSATVSAGQNFTLSWSTTGCAQLMLTENQGWSTWNGTLTGTAVNGSGTYQITSPGTYYPTIVCQTAAGASFASRSITIYVVAASGGAPTINDVTTGCENGKPIATASWSGARDTSGNYWYAIIPGTSYTGGSNYYSGLGPNASMRSTWLRHASTGAALELTPGQSYLFRVSNGQYSPDRAFVAPYCSGASAGSTKQTASLLEAVGGWLGSWLR